MAEWDHPGTLGTQDLVVTTRPSAVLQTVFSNGIDTAQIATVVFVVVLCLLLLGELVSLVIGISLTRTVTGAVHGLYEGTLRIAKGDFSWRIPVKGNDQLAELGHSFNNMTAQIENLVVIAKEKERLQSEVEIASEVQNQLFPRSAPAMRTIELIGRVPGRPHGLGRLLRLSLPARRKPRAGYRRRGGQRNFSRAADGVDSIHHADATRGRTLAPLASDTPAHGNATAAHVSTSSMVAQLNRQLYASTSPEKYATFFFGVYDEHSRILTYTNAGHSAAVAAARR